MAHRFQDLKELFKEINSTGDGIAAWPRACSAHGFGDGRKVGGPSRPPVIPQWSPSGPPVVPQWFEVRERDLIRFLQNTNNAQQTAKMCRVPVRHVQEVMKTLAINSEVIRALEEVGW